MSIFEMKRVVIHSGFRTVHIQIEGRKYNDYAISRASLIRLYRVLDSVPLQCRNVELDESDLAPTAFFYCGKRHKAAQS